MKNQKGFTLIELLIVVAIIGIIAAIAIPSLLRARVSANEAGTIGDIRTVISAQAAYQSANGGFYTSQWNCMVGPTGANCIPSYPSNGPTFVDSAIAALIPKSGYSRSVPTVGPAPSPMNTSLSGPSSVSSYVYAATPVNQGQTGVRGFGGDSSGIVCQNATGVLVGTTTGALTPGTNCDILQ